jgi:hypothetical protein
MLPYEGTHDPYAKTYTAPNRLSLPHDELRSRFYQLDQSLRYLDPPAQYFHFKLLMQQLVQYQYEKQKHLAHQILHNQSLEPEDNQVRFLQQHQHHMHALQRKHIDEFNQYHRDFDKKQLEQTQWKQQQKQHQHEQQMLQDENSLFEELKQRQHEQQMLQDQDSVVEELKQRQHQQQHAAIPNAHHLNPNHSIQKRRHDEGPGLGGMCDAYPDDCQYPFHPNHLKAAHVGEHGNFARSHLVPTQAGFFTHPAAWSAQSRSFQY